MTRDGEPRPLGDALAAVGRELGIDDPGTVIALQHAWVEAVGDAVARHCRPRHLREGVLTVEVDGPEWATQLRYLEHDVVSGLEGALGGHAVRSVRVVVGRRERGS